MPWRPLFLLPGAATYALFVLWPLVQVIRLSVTRWTGHSAGAFIGLTNFGALWDDTLFHQSLMHTARWEIAALVIPTVLALAVALLIVHGRGQPLILAMLFFPALLPPTVVAGIWVLLYSPASGPAQALLSPLGLSPPDWLGDPHLALGALFLAWLWSAFGVGVLVFWAALLGIGREWTELALVEGAGAIWRLRNVILPAIRRPALIVLVMNAALAAQVFDLVFVITGGGPGYATMMLPLEIYGRAFGGRAGQGAAAACLQVALGVILTLIILPLARGQDDAPAMEGEPWRPAPRSLPTAALTAVALTILFPLLWLIPISLQPGRAVAINGPTLSPESWQVGNFADVWNSGMGGAMLTSLLLAVAVVAGTVLLAAPAGFSLAHRRSATAGGSYRGWKRSFRDPLGTAGTRWGWRLLAAGLLLAGLFQPTSVLLIPLFSLLDNLGLLDSAAGIILPEIARALPFAVLALWGFLAQQPPELLEAAEADGASPLRQMLSISLPLARPALVTVAIWAFVTSWNEYLLPTVVSQDGSIQTVPTLLAGFIGRYDTQLGLLAAGSLLAMLPSLLLYLVLRRPAARGLAGVRRSVR